MKQEQDDSQANLEALSEWMDTPSQSISLEQMDEYLRQLSKKRAEHAAAKEEAARIYHELEEAEKTVLNALKNSGKTKYELEGIGRVNIIHKETFSTPKTNEQKIALFNYIKSKYGGEALMAMTTINHQTLNSWCNKEIEGEPGLQIPGLDAPTASEEVRFTKAKS